MGQQEEKRGGIDKDQLLWGVIAGIITVGLMSISYYVGMKKGGEEEEVLGEIVAEIEEKEVYIALKSDCSEYKEEDSIEGGKEIKKFCVEYKEGESAFGVLKRLDRESEDFSFSYDESDLGVFITSINNYHPDITSKFWAFLINGEMSIVGVSDYIVREGDELGFRVEESEF